MPRVQFYLAFANRADAPLPELAREARELRTIVRTAAGRQLCAPLLERHIQEHCRATDLFAMFDGRQPDEVGVLHFGGHGNPVALEFTPPDGIGAGAAHAEPLVRFLSRQKLAMVFLNACSTRAQAQVLLDAQVPAVVVTSRAIKDAVAADFAARFYTSLCAGRDIQTAFLDARDLIHSTHGVSPGGWFDPRRTLQAPERATRPGVGWGVYTDSPRHLQAGNRTAKPPEPGDLPWELILRTPEAGKWNLGSATQNWLALLPELPRDRPLPSPSPFVGLRPYREAEAAVFFGRSRDVWELFHLATQRPLEKVVLVYGRTGAGKSSVLEAGLVPRLRLATRRVGEAVRGADVRFRRVEGGLAPLPLLREALAATPGATLSEAWRVAEQRSGADVFVLLDQLEGVFLRAGEGPADEWRAFVASLAGLSDDLPPGGKLLLGFREEYHARVVKDLADAGLSFAEKRVEPFGPDGVAEAVEGPARDPVLRDKYQLEVEPGLANQIAIDVLSDHQSPVAPTLQLLLTRMFSDGRRFTRDHYERYRREGIHLDRFLGDQLTALRAPPEDWPEGQTEEGKKRWAAEVADTGLVLSVLAEFVTPNDTAGERTEHEIKGRFGHQAAYIPALLRRCKAVYLLVDGESPATCRLGHDTLAPWVRRRVNESQLPGPRAARVLAAQFPEYVKDKAQVRLTELDLKIVLNGERGMPEQSQEQKEFCRVSAEDHASRRRVMSWMRRVAVAVGLAAVVAAVGATLGWWRADSEWRRAESRRLAGVAQRQLQHRWLDRALLLALEAHAVSPTFESRDALLAAITDNPHLERFLYGHSNWVTALAVTDDGNRLATGGHDEKILLWDLSGPIPSARPLPVGEKQWVNALAFTPDGAMLISGTGSTLVGWDVHSTEEVFRVSAASTVTSLALSPDGRWLACGLDSGTAEVWDISKVPTRRHTLKASDDRVRPQKVRGVAFSPDGKTLATADGYVKWWDVESGRERADWHRGGSPKGSHVAFSRKGDQLATEEQVWQKTVGGEQFYLYHRLGREGGLVAGIGLSADGRYLASGLGNDDVVVWDIQSHPAKKVASLRGHKGAVTAVAFRGKEPTVISASWDKTVMMSNLERARPTGGRIDLFKRYQTATGVDDAAFQDDRRVVMVANREVLAWNTADGGIRRLAVFKDLKQHATLAFSRDGRRLAVRHPDNVYLYDVGRDNITQRCSLQGGITSARAIRYRNDGAVLAVGDADGSVWLFNADTGRLIARATDAHGRGVDLKSVHQLAFSEDGSRLASVGAWDQCLLVWAVGPNRLTEIRRVHVASNSPSLLGFHPLNHSVALETWSRVEFWDVTSGKRTETMSLHPYTIDLNYSDVGPASFSDQWGLGVSGDHRGRIALWDVASRRAYSTSLRGNERGPGLLRFSPSGKSLLTAGPDEITWWDTDTESWQAQARKLVNRNLSRIEWAHFVGPDIPYRETVPGLPPVETLLPAGGEGGGD